MRLWIMLPLIHVALVSGLRVGFNRAAVRQRVPQGARSTWSPVSAAADSSLPTNRVYLNVPFEDKEEVKRRGGRWDPEVKKWYVGEYAPKKDFEEWQGDEFADTQYLNVPFDDKDAAKALGARWDKSTNKWYVPKGAPNSVFQKWIEGSTVTAKAKVTKQKVAPPSRVHKEVLFLDIDTNGIPSRTAGSKDYPPYQNVDEYNGARMIQLNATLCDKASLNVVKSISRIIKSDGFSIKNTQFHGVTNERSMKEGLELPEVAKELAAVLKRDPLILAHNAEFDMTILKSELFRHGLTEELAQLEKCDAVCTMLLTKSALGLLDVNGNPKNPSLKELCINTGGDENKNRYDISDLRSAIKTLADAKAIEL